MSPIRALPAARERQNPLAVVRKAKEIFECATELGTAAQRLSIATKQSDESTALLLLHTAARQTSIPTRKLCVDGKGDLLQRKISEPRFLPIGGEKGEFGKATMNG